MADITSEPKPFRYLTSIIILKALNNNRIKNSVWIKSARQDLKIICYLTYRMNFSELSDGFQQLLLKLLYISSSMPLVPPAENWTNINHAEIF